MRNEWSGTGTGFLVNRKIDDQHSRIFIATNKHVIHEKREFRQRAAKVFLDLNIQNPDGTFSSQTAEFPLSLDDGTKRWREHPDDDTDVLAIDVTPLYVQYPAIAKKWADYSIFGDSASLASHDVTIGDEILVIGYPMGLRQGKTNFPLVRGGIVATRIGEVFQDDVRKANGALRTRTLRGFLIDGATIPGSSGSPVVLKPVTGRFVKNNIVMGFTPPLLLGIVAETRYAPIHTSAGETLSFAGLGLAFDAETVKETIELFFQ